MRLRNLAPFVLASLLVAFAMRPAMSQDQPIRVFAAASLKNALDEINATFQIKKKLRIVASYAATSQLIKQIEQGAPADIFFSADSDWMEYGIARKLIRAETRTDLLGNRLVLIAPKDSKTASVEIKPGLDLASLVGAGRLVTADIRAVPAGRYAKAALEKLGIWASVETRLAMAENVRAALALVARGEAPMGIVYETDARIEKNVKVIGIFPDHSHPPIIYSVGLTAEARPPAPSYLAFLKSPEAKATFEKHGFTVLPAGT